MTLLHESEISLHGAVRDYLALALPDDAVMHHSPNEGKRGWRAQRELKDTGVVAGWPDIEIIYQGRVYFIELKIGRRKLSDKQIECHERLARAGCIVGVARSIEDVQSLLIPRMHLKPVSLGRAIEAKADAARRVA